MSKLINPNDYIKLSTYAEKYSICKNKLYRHIKDKSIDYVIIDNLRFIRDAPFYSLKLDHRTKNSKNSKTNVNTLTLQDENHGIVSQHIDLKEDSNVKTLTIGNVKTLTIGYDEIQLLTKDEKECSLSDFQKIEEIRKKYKLI